MLSCSVALLVVGCSSLTSSDATNSGSVSTSAPIITHVQQRFQQSWKPADDPGSAEADINTALEDSGAATLLAEQMPAQTSDSTARLSVDEMMPTGTTVVRLFVSFTQDGQEKGLSLTRLPAGAEGPHCDDRITDAAGGLPGWEAITVRESTGCAVTNESGLGFIQWEEGSSRFHAETRMDVDEVVSWLQMWKSVP